jgi:Mrp family chromosome partitioning ATPase
MSSISETIGLLNRLTKAIGDELPHLQSVNVKFVAPSLHVDAVSSSFGGIYDENRLELLQKWIDNSPEGERVNLAGVMARLPVTINAITEQEAIEKNKWTSVAESASWVSSFIGGSHNVHINQDLPSQKYVHFYGYKGGQARSTVLAMLSKALSDDGYQVLLVDADIEAPSLDLFFGVSADSFSQTLMGLCGWAEEIRPVAGVHAGRTGGRVDLLPCRPRVDSIDLDFAMLAASAPLDCRIYEKAADRLDGYLQSLSSAYDVVMVDHRTGIASSVLPILSRLHGSAVVFIRTDANTAVVPSELKRVVKSIFAATTAAPGVFMSFSLDPNKSASSAKSPMEARTREQLLGQLASVLEARSDASNGEEITTSDLSLNWIDWYLDRSLLEPNLPDVSKLQSDNMASLGLLRETLGLPIGRKQQTTQVSPIIVIDSGSSLSGAKDSGQFIHIPEVESLFVDGNPYTYILGRKGTGKTRLLREMATRGFGLPLLVAADEVGTSGLRSQSIEATAWLERCQYDASVFWWSLLQIAIHRGENDESIDKIISEHLDKHTDPKSLADRLQIKSTLANSEVRRVFLIDGLETLVPAARIKGFVSALFELMGTVQNDPLLATRLTIRAFVREDLAADAVQNVEQQMEGRSLRLKWSATSILNFAVSRLLALKWISRNFEEVCEKIRIQSDRIAKSGLSEQDATAILLQIFPERLRRNNLFTATFLRLYFSDAGGDDTNKATFYPRLYLSFLQKLDELAANSQQPLDAKQRIDSTLLNKAYDAASSEFINETKQELTHLLSLEYEDVGAYGDENDQVRVAKFIAAFAGLSTPFQHETIIGELRSKTNFTERSVRESLQRMKAIRMFEDRPGYAGWWRVGQLYKMGLLMKYVRG